MLMNGYKSKWKDEEKITATTTGIATQKEEEGMRGGRGYGRHGRKRRNKGDWKSCGGE